MIRTRKFARVCFFFKTEWEFKNSKPEGNRLLENVIRCVVGFHKKYSKLSIFLEL